MAKQKKVVKPIRIRTTEEESEQVRQRALKMGAVRVGTRIVSPTHVESYAEFAKAAHAKDFEALLRKKYKGWLIVEVQIE